MFARTRCLPLGKRLPLARRYRPHKASRSGTLPVLHSTSSDPWPFSLRTCLWQAASVDSGRPPEEAPLARRRILLCPALVCPASGCLSSNLSWLGCHCICLRSSSIGALALRLRRFCFLLVTFSPGRAGGRADDLTRASVVCGRLGVEDVSQLLSRGWPTVLHDNSAYFPCAMSWAGLLQCMLEHLRPSVVLTLRPLRIFSLQSI